ncbi:MAG: hypothetical protein JSV91_06870 [Phycisphaerales bacterium]|nr:MAG: hypothetical protein JSV91_06870 [Phycisphaerales bacterium]
MKNAASPARSGSARRPLLAANAILFVLGLITIAVVVNCFANHSNLRRTVDATKTRAYSLSPRTRQLLADLQGEWTIAMIIVESETDPAALRQIDEVLGRYTEAAEGLSVIRIDPTDSSALGEYDGLLARLRSRYRPGISAYEAALDEGEAAFAELQLFAQQQAGVLEQVAAQLEENDPSRRTILLRGQLLALLAQEGGKVAEEVADARRIDGGGLVPDYETARSMLAQALSQWSSELYDTAQLFQRWRRQDDLDPLLRQLASVANNAFEETARRLAVAADPLRQLPPLELSAIGRQIQQGQAAVIIGPPGAAVIASTQLMPKSNLRQTEGGVSFDQRFRGEQLISATIRSLVLEHMPLVVFVHGEEQSLLAQRDRQADLVGVHNILAASRFDVAEWMVGDGEKPTPDDGQPVAWVVVPPPPGRSLQPTPRQQALIGAVKGLIAAGEPVLLSVYPSLLSRYGQTDPWSELPAPFGLNADTSRVILETVPLAKGETETVHAQAVDDFPHPHPIARALNGRQTYFALPVPLGPADLVPQGVEQYEIAAIEPSPNRRLERDWVSGPQAPQTAAGEQPLPEPVPILIAAERPHPGGQGTQRFILVGSGGWMITNVADVVFKEGGRVALVNPGNHELMLSAVAWLAGLDDLIAPSATSQEIARLTGITEAEEGPWWWLRLDKVRVRWFWISIVGLPGGCLLLGVVVWGVRRL